jgi:hypothetical protein
LASGIVAGTGDSIVNRTGRAAAATPGLVYTTRHNQPVTGRCWWFWYLQRSKRVWFRLPGGSEGQPLLFRYDGRPILHRSELKAWQARLRDFSRPLLWNKWTGMGLAAGPRGTTLYLTIWTRWSWLHPEACGSPERFSVEALNH